MNRADAVKALLIQWGACNARALARELVRMVDGDRGSAAVKLTLYQLAFLVSGLEPMDWKDAEGRGWDQWMQECREVVEAPEVLLVDREA